MVVILKKIQKIKEKYYPWIAGAVLIVTIIVLSLSEIYPSLKNILIEKGAINILVLIFVIDGINYLIKINEKLEEKEKTKFYPTQSDASIDVNNYIRVNKPVRADLLYSSSTTIQDIINNLKKNNCKIRLLIAHPNTATSEIEKKRIISRIENLIEMDFKNYDSVEIKCYEKYLCEDKQHSAFPSIRGGKFGEEFICIGWYTPTTKIEGGIMGYENPMICAYTDNESGKILKKHFDDTFKILWDNGIPIKVVYDELRTSSKKN